MFNTSLKKDALTVHQNAVDRYNTSYDAMRDACASLYQSRECAVLNITRIELLVSSIANRPKEFDKQLGEIKQHVLDFHQTKEYADKAYREAIKSGVSILSGVAAGGAIATAAPTVAMSIATTFGTASTGTAISALSGAAAQKAALAWIGRVTGGIATKGVVTGAGMLSGQAFLALAGPIGWGVSAASTTVSLVSLSSKNKKIANLAIEEAKEIMEAREALRETTENVLHLDKKTRGLLEQLAEQTAKADRFRNMDYKSLDYEIQMLLGALMNNTLSLAALLNQTVE
ncbi:MAG: hypothetical protein IJZ38_12995 [Bacteroides sp.]|nr:hypothetical protein [Bacteroides sp.]